ISFFGMGLPWGDFRRAVLRQPAPAVLSVIGRLCVTPSRSRLLFPCSRALGRARETRVPRPQLMEPPSPRSGSPCVSGWTVAPADILKWVALAASYLMRQWTESPVFVDGRRCLEIDAANHILSLNRVAWRNRQDLPSHIKNSPPVYDLAEEAQWVAATFR